MVLSPLYQFSTGDQNWWESIENDYTSDQLKCNEIFFPTIGSILIFI